MFNSSKLLVVVILIIAALSFSESKKSRKCFMCTGNLDYCSLVTLPEGLWVDCFILPSYVNQDDDGCYHHDNKDGRVDRGCLSHLTPAKYKECKESDWCKKCYYDNCNDKLYFPNRTSITKNTVTNNGQDHESKSAAAPMEFTFGAILAFIFVVIAAF